jgi:drug/metabolite transporter (DMT)-like permease
MYGIGYSFLLLAGGIIIWILYSLLCAFFLSLSDLLTKKYVDTAGSIELAFSRIAFAIPLLWLLVYIDGIPPVQDTIYWVYIVALPLELLALLLYIKALKSSPLSVTVPFLSFTPVFLLVSAPLLIGENPSLLGMFGVLAITLGAYLLNINFIKKNLLSPFFMMIKEHGSLLMLCVAFLYSLTSVITKKGVLLSSPIFFAASYFTLLSLLLGLVLIYKGNWKKIFKKELLLISLCHAIMITFHMLALKLVLVSYMISVKRSSILFSILWGVLFFKEKGALYKTISGIIMFAGILLITFYG